MRVFIGNINKQKNRQNMKKYYLLAAAALTLAACSNDESVESNEPVAAQVTASIDNGELTRAIDQNWSANDAIGVMATSVSGTTSGVTSQMTSLYKNVKYTVTSGGDKGNFTSDNGIFFQDASETVTFAAYCPYQASADNATLPGTDGVVTGGKTNEMNGSTADQETIDFLFASGATASKSNPEVEFKDNNQFKHKMSRLKLNVEMGDGFKADEISNITKITLGGLIHEGTFNVTDGTAAASTSTTTVSDWEITNVPMTADNNVNTYTMILYPQTLSKALLLAITVTDGNGSQTYSNTTTIQPALEAGTSYEYTITVKKTGLAVSGCTIAEWGDGGTKDGDATM